MIPSNRIAIVHRIESRDLVHPHWWHLKYPRNLVHDADAREAVLPLSKIEQWHDRCLLVLARVPADHLLDELLILRVELEGYARVVVGCVSVLDVLSNGSSVCRRAEKETYHVKGVAVVRGRDMEAALLSGSEA